MTCDGVHSGSDHFFMQDPILISLVTELWPIQFCVASLWTFGSTNRVLGQLAYSSTKSTLYDKNKANAINNITKT